eukprot:1185341-Prorocentrum_minimum.AAC.5
MAFFDMDAVWEERSAPRPVNRANSGSEEGPSSSLSEGGRPERTGRVRQWTSHQPHFSRKVRYPYSAIKTPSIKPVFLRVNRGSGRHVVQEPSFPTRFQGKRGEKRICKQTRSLLYFITTSYAFRSHFNANADDWKLATIPGGKVSTWLFGSPSCRVSV